MMKLENEALVYKEDTGHILADPILKQHMKQGNPEPVNGYPFLNNSSGVDTTRKNENIIVGHN